MAGKETQPGTPTPRDWQINHEGGRDGKGTRPSGTGSPGGPQDTSKPSGTK